MNWRKAWEFTAMLIMITMIFGFIFVVLPTTKTKLTVVTHQTPPCISDAVISTLQTDLASSATPYLSISPSQLKDLQTFLTTRNFSNLKTKPFIWWSSSDKDLCMVSFNGLTAFYFTVNRFIGLDGKQLIKLQFSISPNLR